MPIAFLADRHRMPRLGRIRLGHKEPVKGKDYDRPVADPFFVLPDELQEFYDPHPTTLNIQFFSSNLEVTFPHYLRYYTKKGLRCLGDGEWILYRVDENGEIDVSDYSAMKDGKMVVVDSVVQRVQCLGDECPNYEKGLCKPTGYLRFIVNELPRQGYYDVVCHQRAVVGIRTQLMLALEMFGRLQSIPFLLHRGEEEQVPVKTPKGVVNMPIRTQWIEVAPMWFAQNWQAGPAMLQESREARQLQAAKDIADLYGDDPEENGDTVESFAEAEYEEEGEYRPLEWIRPEDGKWAESLWKQACTQFGFSGESDVLAALEEVGYDQSAMGKENAKEILAHLRIAADDRGKEQKLL